MEFASGRDFPATDLADRLQPATYVSAAMIARRLGRARSMGARIVLALERRFSEEYGAVCLGTNTHLKAYAAFEADLRSRLQSPAQGVGLVSLAELIRRWRSIVSGYGGLLNLALDGQLGPLYALDRGRGLGRIGLERSRLTGFIESRRRQLAGGGLEVEEARKRLVVRDRRTVYYLIKHQYLLSWSSGYGNQHTIDPLSLERFCATYISLGEILRDRLTPADGPRARTRAINWLAGRKVLPVLGPKDGAAAVLYRREDVEGAIRAAGASGARTAT
jgi:hypothetical protein